MKKILAAFFFLGCFSAFAQTTSFRIPCGGISPPANEKEDWLPTLTVAREADQLDEETGGAVKDSLSAVYRNRPHTRTASSARSASAPGAPVVGTTFAGNGYGSSTPCDNEIAVANNGHLISVQNSTVFRYKTATSTALGIQSLALWALPLGNSNSKYDPKVIYDPEANRFILVCLAGFLSNSTNILVGFSQSDSVNGSYNLYSLPGNPFNDTLWTDYPMIAVNGHDFFCTVNLLHDNQSWQTGFVQSIIWQINKWDGYNGDTLNIELHSGINTNGRPIRNLCPVEGGSHTYAGPDMYFLSERNLDAANDTVFLIHVTDTVNSPNQQVNVTALVSNQSYFMPPNASQPSYNSYGRMSTNDSRILGAFIQNDQIQYVSNTMDTATGFCAVYHGRIANVSGTPSLTGTIIGDTLSEFAYPNIAYAGQGTSTDNTAILFFLHSDSTNFPGNSAMVTDGNGAYSPRTIVKQGLGYINVLSGDERWGDYSGIQRRYDAGATCWVNGMYGLSNHTHATWIAELGISADVSVPAQENETMNASVYPNPFADHVNIEFENAKAQNIRFVVYDMSGRMVTLLLQDYLPEGEIRFGFSTTPLASGVYFLRAETAEGETLFTQKLVKQ